MTLRTILGSHKSQNSKHQTVHVHEQIKFILQCVTAIYSSLAAFTGLFCLVSWIEENTLSVISIDKIVSPSKEDITVGCMCKVKKFEKYLAQVKAIGRFVAHIHMYTLNFIL